MNPAAAATRGYPREARLARRLIRLFGLDLDGLVVLTEAASGPYLFTPVLAAMAGARHVHAVARSSPWGPAGEIAETTLRAAAEAGVAQQLSVQEERRESAAGEADIVVNCGFLRPIDRGFVRLLKPTAVIPLMWETWEWRSEELDLDACREKGILVLGTDEAAGPRPFVRYTGMAGLELLRRLGVSAAGAGVVVLGAQQAIGEAVHRALERAGACTAWFGRDDDLLHGGRRCRPYRELPEFLTRHGTRIDALVVAEHRGHGLLLGPGGLVEPSLLARMAPRARVAHMAGPIDAASLRASGIALLPETIRPPGHMSFHAGLLGALPVLHLFASGLRVAQSMARARISGLGPSESARRVLDDPLAMDFPAPRSWVPL